MQLLLFYKCFNMKKLLIVVSLFFITNTYAQMSTSFWCANNVHYFADSATGKNKMQFNVVANGASNFIYHYYAIISIILNNGDTLFMDPVHRYNPNFYAMLDSSLLLSLNVDTSITSNQINALEVLHGIPTCGIWWKDSFYLASDCNAYNSPNQIKNQIISTNITFVNNTIRFLNNNYNRPIYIYNLSGQLLIKSNCTVSKEIDLNYLPNGVYFLVNNNKSQKIIVQH